MTDLDVTRSVACTGVQIGEPNSVMESNSSWECSRSGVD
jgi:hypothetical protein